MSRGIIIRHSFVAGLADHHAGQHGLPDGTYRRPSEVASDLRVSDQMDWVFLSGVRGASLCDGRYKLPTIAIDNERPHFVVLQIGTNDLACGVPPYEVACEVLNTAHELVMDYGAMRVVICGALYRIGHLRVPSHVDFDAVTDSYNTILREMCASECFVVYRSHSGFWGNPIHTWSQDGIHPNTSFGRKLYIKSLRQILLETSSFLRQPLSAKLKWTSFCSIYWGWGGGEEGGCSEEGVGVGCSEGGGGGVYSDCIDTLRPRQNDHHFADGIFKYIKTFALRLKICSQVCNLK